MSTRRVRLDHRVIHVGVRTRSNVLHRDVHGPGLAPTPPARVPVPPDGSDPCPEWPGPIAAAAYLECRGVAVELGPLRRPGECGFGRNVYVRDPDGPSPGFIPDAAP